MSSNNESNGSKETADRRISRRTALGAIGGSAITGLGGNLPESSTESKVQFAEVGLVFDPSTRLQDYKRIHVEGPPEYAVRADANKLYLLKHVSSSEKRLFQNRDTILRAGGLTPAPANAFDGENLGAIPTRLDSQLKPASAAVLTERRSIPAPTVETNGRTLRVSGAGTSGEVRPGEIAEFELPTRTLPLKRHEVKHETVDRPDIPADERALRTETWAESVEVRPTLRVQYYGSLDIVDISDSTVAVR